MPLGRPLGGVEAAQDAMDFQPGRGRGGGPSEAAATAPLIVPRVGGQAGSDRIEMDVAGQSFQVRWGLHEERLETTLEHVPHALVPPVVVRGVG